MYCTETACHHHLIVLVVETTNQSDILLPPSFVLVIMSRLTSRLLHLTRALQTSPSFASSASAAPDTLPQAIPLRDYIQATLYDATSGYFTTSSPPVLHSPTPLHPHTLSSRAVYTTTVHALHSGPGWLTPAELFSPYLSHAFARRIRSVASHANPVLIIELGAGRATLARDILDYYMTTDPDFYARMQYLTVELSAPLAALQRIVLAPHVTAGRAVVHHSDARNWLTELHAPPCAEDDADTIAKIDSFMTPTTAVHVIATEVLDNLPHDLLRSEGGLLHQMWVNPSRTGLSDVDGHSMLWRQLDIPCQTAHAAFGMPTTRGLGDMLRSVVDGLAGASEVWVPTAAHQLLHGILSSFPQASLTLADFDSLPGAMPGGRAPVVQRVVGGRAVVYDDVLRAPFGMVDVMFPTDFPALITAHTDIAKGLNVGEFERRFVKQAEFFREFATADDVQKATCKDGYSPVLQDFENAAVLMVDPV